MGIRAPAGRGGRPPGKPTGSIPQQPYPGAPAAPHSRGLAVLNNGWRAGPPVKTRKHKGWDNGIGWTAEELVWTEADTERMRAARARNEVSTPITSAEIKERYNLPDIDESVLDTGP